MRPVCWSVLLFLAATIPVAAQQPADKPSPQPTTAAEAPKTDTSYIDERGTALVTRVVPVPDDISSQAQLAVGHAEPDQGPPESLE